MIMEKIGMMDKSVRELMGDKSFYTVIRRFRYQYKKYNALRELDGEFYDKNLREAYKNAECDLMNTTAKIILMVFGVFIDPNNTSLEFSQDVDACYRPLGRLSNYRTYHQKYEVTVNDKEFYDFVRDLLVIYMDGVEL